MVKPLGGRGKKAPYQTVQMRVPEPIKQEVEALVAQYRAEVLSVSSGSVLAERLALTCDDCIKLVDRFIDERGLSEKLTQRNNINLVRFREWLLKFSAQ